MPHNRNRYLEQLIQKRLSFSPVLTLQGARQTGKSFFLRELLFPKLKNAIYLTLDSPQTEEEAQRQPETFIERHLDYQTIVIDEVQKAPKLFDVIKLFVDRERRPGKFILTGSTEFSKELKIKESLTGRMSRSRFFPLTLAETLGLESDPCNTPFYLQNKPRVKRSQVLTFLENGGFPSAFSIRDKSIRTELLKSWLELICFRDAMRIPALKIDPDLCYRMMEKLAILEDPTASELAKSFRKDLRVIVRHLFALKTLFAIHSLDPHPLSTGKTRFYLVDVGLAHALGASFKRCLETWTVQELLAKHAFQGEIHPKLYFYRTQKGSLIDFVSEDQKKIFALQIFAEEKIQDRDLELLRAFSKKDKQIETFGLGHKPYASVKDKIKIFAFEALG